MEQNKVRTYILYALGEVLLVVIGILIALQVNNWNENRKEAREETFYLQKLRQNLSQDTLAIRTNQNMIENHLESIRIIAAAIKDPTLDSFPLNMELPLLSMVPYRPVTSTWNNLQATGKISLVQNEHINEKLYQYYDDVFLGAEGWITAITTYSRNTIGPFLMDFDQLDFFMPDSLRLDFKYHQKKPIEYNSSLFFKNALTFKYNAYVVVSSELDVNHTAATELIQMIEEELGE